MTNAVSTAKADHVLHQGVKNNSWAGNNARINPARGLPQSIGLISIPQRTVMTIYFSHWYSVMKFCHSKPQISLLIIMLPVIITVNQTAQVGMKIVLKVNLSYDIRVRSTTET